MTKEEVKDMFSMRVDGYSYRDIGEKYGVTRQRAQQILSRVIKGKSTSVRKNYIYPNIDNWMFENNISQSDIAKWAGCTQNTISSVLTGKHDPSYSVISAVLEMSGMTFQEAFRKKGEDDGLS